MLSLLSYQKSLRVYLLGAALGTFAVSLALPLVAKENSTEKKESRSNKRKAKKLGKKNLLAKKPIVALRDISPQKADARTRFRKRDYVGAILSIDKNSLDSELKWILAESLFRTNRFAESKEYFQEILAETDSRVDSRKAGMRVFEIDLRTKNLQSAIDNYLSFKGRYKKVPARMSYGLGKELYDAGFEDRAVKILRRVFKNKDFAMRARYIVAAIDLAKKKPVSSTKAFSKIAKMTPGCVEDYSVREMARLAVARLYVTRGKLELAEKAFKKVSLNTSFGKTATIELIRAMISRAEQAEFKEGRFKKYSDFRAGLEQEKAISSALAAMERYRKGHEVDWQTPELLTLMGYLYGKSKRFDEAELAYKELLDHYRGIHDTLLNDENDADKVWPYFALNFFDEKKARPINSILVGLPRFLIGDFPELSEISRLRESIEASGKKLSELEWRARKNSLATADEGLIRARVNQQAIEAGYRKMVLGKQLEIKKLTADMLNQAVAEAEYKRAEVALEQMRQYKKQLDAVRDYQTKQLEAFEDSLLKKQDGGDS